VDALTSIYHRIGYERFVGIEYYIYSYRKNITLKPLQPKGCKGFSLMFLHFFYCNCVYISLRDLSSSTLLAVLVTYLYMYRILSDSLPFSQNLRRPSLRGSLRGKLILNVLFLYLHYVH